MSEKYKYEGIYSCPESYPNYGRTNHGKKALSIVENSQIESLLDVGCGFNHFIAEVKANSPGVRSVGVDFACPGADIIAEAHSLPFHDKEFDLLTSFDMLEHLTEDLVIPSLLEMSRVSKRFILSVSYRESSIKWKGQALHPTVRPEEWWIDRLMQSGATKIRRQAGYLMGEWSPRFFISKEQTVVLVGNGLSATESRLGKVIDAFDVVIRFNDYVTDEYSTGTKTSFWAGIPADGLEPKHTKVLCQQEKFDDRFDEFYHIPSWFYRRVHREYADRQITTKKFHYPIKPSNELITCLFLTRVLDLPKVYLIGFDQFPYNELEDSIMSELYRSNIIKAL